MTKSSVSEAGPKNIPPFMQNQHLTVLAGLHVVEHYMLYAHGLCHNSELRYGKRGQATDYSAIVQNQHLAVLAGLHVVEHFLLYGRGLCHDSELR